jgi:16S rRNA C1402 (ribose-2'-O) methylase RsmI
MDRELALRLIHPIQEGDEVCLGHTLVSVEVHLDASRPKKDAIHLVFSPDLSLIFTCRTDGQCAFQTAHFNIAIRQPDPTLSQANRRVIGVIKERLAANDTEPPRDWVDLASLPNHSSPSQADLWLIPGHIGNALDLSIRSLRVLQLVDLVFVEDGAQSSMEGIYEQFGLGQSPEVFALSHQVDDWNDVSEIVGQLERGHRAGKVMALFGVHEGIPGVCDPGWRVMRAVSHLGSTLKVRSLSAGSALSTSLMYTDLCGVPFIFLGLLKPTTGHSAFIRMLSRVTPASRSPSLMCFTNGVALQAVWADLVQMVQNIEGRLSLYKNLTRPNEQTARFMLSTLSTHDADGLVPSDKIVMRIDFEWAYL